MAKIRVESKCPLYDGISITFKAPCSSDAVDGLNVYYNNVSSTFTFRDAHGANLAGNSNLFAAGAYVKVVLNTTNNFAYLQNADTNNYLDAKLTKLDGRPGDIKTTLRTDLGDSWALCNGDIVYMDGTISEEFYDVLAPDYTAREMEFPEAGSSSDVTPMFNGMWCISQCKYPLDGGYDYRGCVVYDPRTGFKKNIHPRDINETYEYGTLIGITWNGSKFVSCLMYSERLIFHETTDLESWTQVYSYKPSDPPGDDRSYGDFRFLWDGVAYRVSCQYRGYQAARLYTVSANYSSVAVGDTTNCKIFAADGLFSIARENYVDIYNPGQTTKIRTITLGNQAHAVMEKYADGKYITAVIVNSMSGVCIYDKNANTTKVAYAAVAVGLSSTTGSYQIPFVGYDSKNNEFVFYVQYVASTTSKYYISRLPADKDPTVSANYTYVEVATTPKYVRYRLAGDFTYAYPLNGKLTVSGLYPRCLPTISFEGAYTYIKVREGS